MQRRTRPIRPISRQPRRQVILVVRRLLLECGQADTGGVGGGAVLVGGEDGEGEVDDGTWGRSQIGGEGGLFLLVGGRW